MTAEIRPERAGDEAIHAVTEAAFRTQPASAREPALIRRGMAELAARGARGIVVLGSPRYYRRLGFAPDPALTYPGPPAEYFQRRVLAGAAPRGAVAYEPAFG